MIICVPYAQFKITASLAKGAVCAGGTRLPPTEPTGEIGIVADGGGIAVSLAKVRGTVRGVSPPAPYAPKFFAK